MKLILINIFGIIFSFLVGCWEVSGFLVDPSPERIFFIIPLLIQFGICLWLIDDLPYVIWLRDESIYLERRYQELLNEYKLMTRN